MLLLREDSIRLLPLSEKAIECLYDREVKTIEQFARAEFGFMPVEIRSEVRNALAQVLSRNQTSVLPLEQYRLLWTFRHNDCPTSELPLQSNLLNRLSLVHFRTASAILSENVNTLSASLRIRKKEVKTVLEKVQAFMEERAEEVMAERPPELESFPAWAQDLVKELATICGIPPVDSTEQLLDTFGEIPENPDPATLESFFRREDISLSLVHHILYYLSLHGEGVEIEGLLDLLPSSLGLPLVKEIVREMEENGQVILWHTLVQRTTLSFLEFIPTIEHPAGRVIFETCADGRTLQSAGEELGVSRQRVDQIKKRVLEKKPALLEDRYLDLVTRYELDLGDFIRFFDEPPSTWYYLRVARPSQGIPSRLPIKEALKDPAIPASIRNCVQEIVYKDFIIIDGKRVQLTRPALARAAAERYCQETISMDRFMEQYDSMLEELGLQNNPRFIIAQRTYENKFDAASYVLWNMNRRMRFYDVKAADTQDFYRRVDLERYRDLDISSRRILQDYPDVMKDFDIRDEYELHNFLRKTIPQDLSEKLRVVFRRMPTICFGDADISRQTYDLMASMAPVTVKELTQRFAEIYGYNTDTIISNYLGAVQNYCHQGVFRVDRPSMPPEQVEVFRKLVPIGFTPISRLQEIYLEAFPGSDPARVNGQTLKEMGLQVYTTYALRGPWDSCREYFREEFQRDEVLDLREWRERYGNLPHLYNYTREARLERSLLEFAPDLAYTAGALARMGITERMMNSFCMHARLYYEDNVPFTVHWLRLCGMSHPLMKHSDWLLGSILCSGPTAINYGSALGSRIYWSGRGNYNFMHLCLQCLQRHEILTRQKMLEKVEEEYDVTIPLNRFNWRTVLAPYYDYEREVFNIHLPELGLSTPPPPTLRRKRRAGQAESADEASASDGDIEPDQPDEDKP